MRTTVFICDTCGEKKKLDRTKEHWCTNCAGRKETEMRPVGIRLSENLGLVPGATRWALNN